MGPMGKLRDSDPGLFVAGIDVKRWYHLRRTCCGNAAANFGIRR
jgi:hypothetical protein